MRLIYWNSFDCWWSSFCGWNGWFCFLLYYSRNKEIVWCSCPLVSTKKHRMEVGLALNDSDSGEDEVDWRVHGIYRWEKKKKELFFIIFLVKICRESSMSHIAVNLLITFLQLSGEQSLDWSYWYLLCGTAMETTLVSLIFTIYIDWFQLKISD